MYMHVYKEIYIYMYMYIRVNAGMNICIYVFMYRYAYVDMCSVCTLICIACKFKDRLDPLFAV